MRHMRLALMLGLGLLGLGACAPGGEFQFNPGGFGGNAGAPDATFAGSGAWNGAAYAAGVGGGGFTYDQALGPGSEQ